MAAFPAANESVEYYVFEMFFVFDMIVHFFLDYMVPRKFGGKLCIREFEKIAKNYYNTRFIYDAIPLLPL